MSQLPPTEDATSHHSLRVYIRIQTWLGNDLNALDYGWTRDNEAKLVPIILQSAPVPAYLGTTESCKCTTGYKNRRCACVKAGVLCKYYTCTQCTNYGPAEAEDIISDVGSSTEASEGQEFDGLLSSTDQYDDDSGSDYSVESSSEED